MILDQCTCLASFKACPVTLVGIFGGQSKERYQLIESKSNQSVNGFQFRVLLPNGCQGLGGNK